MPAIIPGYEYDIFISYRQNDNKRDHWVTSFVDALRDELEATLKRVAEYFPGGAVIIRGDRRANLGRAIAILDKCKNADIQNVSFAALPPEAEGGLQ